MMSKHSYKIKITYRADNEKIENESCDWDFGTIKPNMTPIDFEAFESICLDPNYETQIAKASEPDSYTHSQLKDSNEYLIHYANQTNPNTNIPHKEPSIESKHSFQECMKSKDPRLFYIEKVVPLLNQMKHEKQTIESCGTGTTINTATTHSNETILSSCSLASLHDAFERAEKVKIKLTL